MIEVLSESSLLLLFVGLAVGALLVKIKIAGINRGIASVLFTGLALLFTGLVFGALSPDIKLPAIVSELGLALFISCIGISGGEQFSGNLNKKGWQINLLALGSLSHRYTGNYSGTCSSPFLADMVSLPVL